MSIVEVRDGRSGFFRQIAILTGRKSCEANKVRVWTFGQIAFSTAAATHRFITMSEKLSPGIVALENR